MGESFEVVFINFTDIFGTHVPAKTIWKWVSILKIDTTK